MATFSKAVQRQIDEIEEKIAKLEREETRLKRLIDELQTVDSPIQPGDTIEWVHWRNEKTGATVIKRGQVVSMDYEYHGRYVYRCTVFNARGIAVGFSTVTEGKTPTLIKKARAKKVSKKKPAKKRK